MATFHELRGTTFGSFTIGKRGPTLTQISTTGLTIAALPSATVTPGGPITLTAGANTSALGDGGAINLNGGTGSLTTGSGGKVNLNGGAGSGISLTSNGGAVELNGGTGGGSGGDIVLRSGASVTAAGAVRLIANNSSGVGAVGGDIIQTAGSGPSGGAITITAGPGSTDDGGSITITSGTSTSASTGDIGISTAGTTAGAVGTILITGGAASGAGQAGSISIAAGAGTAVGAAGGDVTIAAGNTANATNGGNINLQPGTGRRAVNILPAGTAAGQTSELRFRELAANGTNYVGFKGPDDPVANTIWTLPAADGLNRQQLQTNAAGVLSWGSDADFLHEIFTSAAQVLGTAAIVVNYNTVRSANANFTVAAGVITIGASAAGRYLIDYSVALDSTNNTNDLAIAELFVNGVAYPSSRAYALGINLATGEAMATKRVTAQFAAGATVEVRVNLLTASGASTISGQSNIILERKGP